MLRRLSLAMAIASIVSTPSWAEPTPAAQTSLMGVYKAAVKNNSDLAAAGAELAARQESVPQAMSALLPQLNGALINQNNRTSLDQPALTLERSGNSYQANLSQPLFNAAAWFQLKAANATSEQAAVEFSAVQQNLILQTAEAYYNVLERQDNLAASKAEEAAFKRQLDQATERFDVGLSDKTDVLEAQASHDTAKANRLLSERFVEDAFQALTTLTNQTYPGISGLMHTLPILPPAPLDAQAWVDTSTRQNLQLQASNFALEAAQQSLNKSKSGHAPTVNAVASYAKGDNDSLGFVNSGMSPLTTIAPYGSDAEQSSIGVQLNVPLYSGGLTSSQVRQSYDVLQQTEFQQESLRRQVVQNARDLFRAVNSNVEQVGARKQTIVSNKSALEATQIGYEVGTRDIVDVLDAQRQLFASVRNYNTARYAYILSNLRLKLTAGTLSPSDLQELDKYLSATYDPDKDFLPPDVDKDAKLQLQADPGI
ncbi:TolC family outer membrane protein [Pseudomonas sp. N040]|uniref:TolC family outer membrane protein n=1 Tax=Pseudomonas sp. N040 TaxID=2785325 RepID=UPI0018A33154|nr:TolC family outer membrane protein [Pseudomonas sp. N040]MBF7730192.1 TolC family outer membrane protein [Pseudomonas sp. N040]MBW7013834.1 TolC family outer membrane protein [Pseudomonas sp. N040]